MTTIRIGEVLVNRGTLNAAQVQAILDEQLRSHRPFGELAENMYNVDPTDIEQAWMEQYARLTRHVNVLDEMKEDRAMQSIERRQAWQFRVVPLRFDGKELMVATTPDNLCRALRFVTRCLSVPCYIVLTEARMLGEALERHFPLPGMTASFVGQRDVNPMALLAGE